MGNPDCVEGLTTACLPFEERCVMDVCGGDTICESCFPGDEPDANTYSCLQSWCSGEQGCLDQILVVCGS
jgi:hypothetical protein